MHDCRSTRLPILAPWQFRQAHSCTGEIARPLWTTNRHVKPPKVVAQQVTQSHIDVTKP